MSRDIRTRRHRVRESRRPRRRPTPPGREPCRRRRWQPVPPSPPRTFVESLAHPPNPLWVVIRRFCPDFLPPEASRRQQVSGRFLAYSADKRPKSRWRRGAPRRAAALGGLYLDLDIHTGRKIQPLQRVHRLRRGLEDVEQALVHAHLEVLARVLVL